MTLQKKQIYLNKVLSKHYKKLRNTLFNNVKNIPALETPAVADAQSIGISVLTIGTVNHKDFPNIVDVSFLNGLRKTKKAVIVYEGKTEVPTAFTRFIEIFQRHSKTKKLKETNNLLLLNSNHTLKPKNNLGKFEIIDNMLGAGVCIHNYKLCFNSQLSLQHLNVLKRKQRTKLKNLDRLAACLIVSQHAPWSFLEYEGVRTKVKDLEVRGAFKMKEIRLSKTELSSVVAQVLYKTHFFKNQKTLGESFFRLKKLSNVLGALVEINSKIYYISDKELKQCGLAGSQKHSASSLNTPEAPSLLKDLIHFKMTKDKKVLLKTKCIEPSIVFFTFLNTATRTYVIHNLKRILGKLVHILSFLALPKSLGEER